MSHTDYFMLAVDQYPSDLVLRCGCGWSLLVEKSESDTGYAQYNQHVADWNSRVGAQ